VEYSMTLQRVHWPDRVSVRTPPWRTGTASARQSPRTTGSSSECRTARSAPHKCDPTAFVASTASFRPAPALWASHRQWIRSSEQFQVGVGLLCNPAAGRPIHLEMNNMRSMFSEVCNLPDATPWSMDQPKFKGQR
jgi:hypothetical protein